MIDLRKAAEMALAKLDHLWEIGVDISDLKTDVLPEIQALRQALAQPEQEPVAWMYELNGENHLTFTDQSFIEKAHPHLNKSKQLYTAPPKREWIGLTDKQIYEHEWWDEETAYAVNKFLMEKNGG